MSKYEKIVGIFVSTYQVLEVSSFLMCFCLGSFSKTDTYHIENFGFITEKIYCKSHKIVTRILQVNVFIGFLEIEFPITYISSGNIFEKQTLNLASFKARNMCKIICLVPSKCFQFLNDEIYSYIKKAIWH